MYCTFFKQEMKCKICKPKCMEYLKNNPNLKQELEEIKKQLGPQNEKKYSFQNIPGYA